MTYTFKLSRRLAVARLGSLVLLSGLLACSASDAPVGLQSQNPLDYSLATVHLSPSSVTAEVNQPVRLAAFGRNSLGDSMAVSDLTWSASGGTISPDGTFSASAPGTYTLTASSQHGQKTGHGRVVVLAPPVGLSAVVVSPDTATLYTHEQHPFTAAGRMSDGSEATIGVNWTASGGTIDAGGLYTAGPSGGTFRIVATNGSSGYADTAVVTILAPVVDTAGTDTTQATPPPAGATVDSVVIAPSGITLAPGSSQQFTATRYFSDGSHQFDGVTFSATGGSVSPSGLYTAGASTGNFRVVATDPSSGRSDTAQISLQAAIVPPTGGSALYPHQPSGMSRVIENGFQGFDSAIYGDWGSPSNTTRVSISQDVAAPVSPNSVLDTRFPTGMESGIAPVTWRAWAPGAPTYRKLYVSLWIKLPGATFQNQPVGTKLWYVGYGNKDQDNDGFLVLQGTGQVEDMSAIRLVMNVSETDDRDGPSYAHTQNVDGRALVTVGQWHHIEVYLAQGTVDQHDGTVRIWVDGTKVSDYTNMKFLDSRHSFTMGFFDWQWTPVWGGVGGTRTREDHILLDHIYISGSN